MIRFAKIVLVASLLTATAGTALAQGTPPSPEEQAVSYRQSIVKAMSWKLGQLAAAKEAGDAKAFRQHATDMYYLSGLIVEGFIPNSKTSESHAKPEVWEDWDHFVETAEGFRAKVSELTEPGYDIASFDPRGFGGEACGSCHRPYRERD